MLEKIKNPSVKRHIAKTITWRIVGTVDTMFLGWIITGNPITGLKIGGLELVTKMALYFAHERVWYKSDYGLPDRKKNIVSGNKGKNSLYEDKN